MRGSFEASYIESDEREEDRYRKRAAAIQAMRGTRQVGTGAAANDEDDGPLGELSARLVCNLPARLPLPTPPASPRSPHARMLDDSGAGDVRLVPEVSPNGLEWISADATEAFVKVAAPQVHALEPAVVSSAGGSTLDLIGGGFPQDQGAAVAFVRVGDVVVEAEIVDDGVVRCVLPSLEVSPGASSVPVHVGLAPASSPTAESASFVPSPVDLLVVCASVESIKPCIVPAGGGCRLSVAIVPELPPAALSSLRARVSWQNGSLCSTAVQPDVEAGVLRLE